MIYAHNFIPWFASNISFGLPQQVPSLGQASTVAHDAAAPNTNKKSMYNQPITSHNSDTHKSGRKLPAATPVITSSQFDGQPAAATPFKKQMTTKHGASFKSQSNFII